MTIKAKTGGNPNRVARMTDEEVLSLYERTFGEALQDPPLDYGHHNLSVEDLAEYGLRALAEGKAIDWSLYLAPLPDGAVSQAVHRHCQFAGAVLSANDPLLPLGSTEFERQVTDLESSGRTDRIMYYGSSAFADLDASELE